MVNFVDINPADIDTTRNSRRGRISYPILKAFMERQSKVSKLDLTGLNKNPTYLRSVLQAYIKSHDMPIRIFAANGDIHLMRLDLDNDNNPIPWTPEMETSDGHSGMHQHSEPVAITDAEVDARFKAEKGQSTK